MSIPIWQPRKQRLRTIKCLATVLQQSLVKLEFELWLKTQVLSPKPKTIVVWGHACEVVQSCSTLWDPKDCRPPGSSVHGILQARILEWVAGLSSRGSSPPKDWTWVSCVFCIARPLGKPRVGSHIDPNLVLQLVSPSGQPTLLLSNTSCSPSTAQTCTSKPQISSKMTCL